MNLFLGGVGTCMAFFGIFLNLYVIIVLLLNKKARTSSEWILLHLSWCGLGASFFNLCLISPSIFMARWLTSTGSLCSLVGASVLTLQLLTVWSICALSADRCAAIASPLRYTQLVTGRRVAIFFLIIWILSIGTAMAAFIVSSIKQNENNFSSHPSNSNIYNTYYDTSYNSTNAGSSISVIGDKNNYLIESINSSYRYVNRSNSANGNIPSSLPSDIAISSSTLPSHPHYDSSSIPYRSSSIGLLASMSPSSFSVGTAQHLENDSNFVSSSSQASGFPGKIMPRFASTALSTNVQKEKTGRTNYTSSILPSSLEEQNDGFTTSRAAAASDLSIESNKSEKEDSDGIQTTETSRVSEFRAAMGLCLPRVYYTSLPSVLWLSEWIFLILVAPLCTILVCDLVVLSIARKQRHRIVMALYQITLSAQATVVRKGTTPPQLWLNRSIPARSRAVRAVFEDFFSLVLIHLPLILILVFEMLVEDHHAPVLLHFLGSISLFLSPSFTALLYGIRARSLRAAYKSYIRKRMTNNTLQHEIQQRLSPVDGGSPRPSSGAKSFRSCTPSPASSPIQTPRRLSTNDLRPPPMHFPMNSGANSPVSPLPGPHTSTLLGTEDASHFFLDQASSSSGTNVIVNHNHNSYDRYDDNDGGDSHHVRFSTENGGFGGASNNKPRKIRSFLHLPNQHDMQEFWSGLRRPNRSPTIIITHEIRMKESSNMSYDSKSIANSPTAEQRL